MAVLNFPAVVAGVSAAINATGITFPARVILTIASAVAVLPAKVITGVSGTGRSYASCRVQRRLAKTVSKKCPHLHQ